MLIEVVLDVNEAFVNFLRVAPAGFFPAGQVTIGRVISPEFKQAFVALQLAPSIGTPGALKPGV